MIDTTARAGFPETLGYVVWALTMVLPAIFVLCKILRQLEHDWQANFLGCAAGF